MALGALEMLLNWPLKYTKLLCASVMAFREVSRSPTAPLLYNKALCLQVRLNFERMNKQEVERYAQRHLQRQMAPLWPGGWQEEAKCQYYSCHSYAAAKHAR
jgi:hypothetical protein